MYVHRYTITLDKKKKKYLISCLYDPCGGYVARQRQEQQQQHPHHYTGRLKHEP